MNRSVPFSSPRRCLVPEFSPFFSSGPRLVTGTLSFIGWCLATGNAAAQTNSLAFPSAPFPDASASLFRVMGALALVLGLFLVGVWLFKNWHRLAVPRSRQPRLNILETRSLGARQAVFVVAYDRQRFLVATSAAGVNLLSHLPDADANEAEGVEKTAGPMSFSQALAQVLKRK